MKREPLVSVVTPFYNTAAFLSEAIESILAQTYPHFELLLVNNKSTDDSREIAQRYAARDARLRLIDNEEFVDQVTNYNGALAQISGESKYVKIVQADDLIFPACLAQMVEVAERHPRVGIVSSYYLQGAALRGEGLPYNIQDLSGREACRRMLLTGCYLLGSPTTVMYRADLVRARKPFYASGRYHEDTEAAYEILLEQDLGFVPQVLSFLRTDSASIMGRDRANGGDLLDYFIILERFGAQFLSPDEFAHRRSDVHAFFYKNLGRAYLRRRGSEFWEYQRTGLATVGRELSFKDIAPYAARELLRMLLNPQRSLSEALSTLRDRLRSSRQGPKS